MKCSLTVSRMEGFFQMSLLSTWQSKMEGSWTLMRIHFSFPLPSSRASGEWKMGDEVEWRTEEVGEVVGFRGVI